MFTYTTSRCIIDTEDACISLCVDGPNIQVIIDGANLGVRTTLAHDSVWELIRVLLCAWTWASFDGLNPNDMDHPYLTKEVKWKGKRMMYIQPDTPGFCHISNLEGTEMSRVHISELSSASEKPAEKLLTKDTAQYLYGRKIKRIADGALFEVEHIATFGVVAIAGSEFVAVDWHKLAAEYKVPALPAETTTAPPMSTASRIVQRAVSSEHEEQRRMGEVMGFAGRRISMNNTDSPLVRDAIARAQSKQQPTVREDEDEDPVTGLSK